MPVTQGGQKERVLITLGLELEECIVRPPYKKGKQNPHLEVVISNYCSHLKAISLDPTFSEVVSPNYIIMLHLSHEMTLFLKIT